MHSKCRLPISVGGWQELQRPLGGNPDTVSGKAGLIAGTSIDRPHTGNSPCGATGADLVEPHQRAYSSVQGELSGIVTQGLHDVPG